jgi:hypothetical protein
MVAATSMILLNVFIAIDVLMFTEAVFILSLQLRMSH